MKVDVAEADLRRPVRARRAAADPGQGAGRRHLRLQTADRRHRGRRAVEGPAEPAEGDRARPEGGAGVGDDGLQVEAAGVPLARDRPEDEDVGGQHEDESPAHRPLAEPGGVVLQLMEVEPVVGEPVEQPRSQPEETDLLGRGRLGGQVVGVRRVATGCLHGVGVPVAPHAALAQQPVGGPPGGQEHERRPPRETDEHQGGGDAAEQQHETLGDEVDVEVHRWGRPPQVEVAGRRQVVAQVAALEVADAVGAEGRGHQPVVEDAAEPVTQQCADDLVDRGRDLRHDEDDTEDHQRHGQVGAGLEPSDQQACRDRQRGRHQRPDREQGPPRRGEPGHRAGEGREELGSRPSGDPGQPDPRQESGHPVTLGEPGDSPSNPFGRWCVLEA